MGAIEAFVIFFIVGSLALLYLVLRKHRRRLQDEALLKEARELAARYEVEAAPARERCEEEEAKHECSFWFVDAQYILAFDTRSSGAVTLPAFQALHQIPGALHKHTITRNDAFRATLTAEYCAVSHRWFDPREPDKGGEQLRALQDYLRRHRQIRYVWYDFWSMPQDERTAQQREEGKPDTRTPAQRVEFTWMLRNVNMLYLGCSVLILLDLSYISRFWTQFEAWLSMQLVSRDGLQPAPPNRRRCEVVPIVNANSIMAESLFAMWASKTPDEARAVLEKDDVTVTNQGDKVTQLGKLAKLDEEAREVMILGAGGGPVAALAAGGGSGGRSMWASSQSVAVGGSSISQAREAAPSADDGGGVEMGSMRAAASGRV